MHVNSLFPSNFIAASDLQGQDVPVVIRALQSEEVGSDKEDRPVVYFQGISKGMVLNRTNAKRIAKLYGSETDAWIGKTIVLYESETDFQGDVVPCIRVRQSVPVGSLPTVVTPLTAPLGQQAAQQSVQQTVPQQTVQPPVTQQAAPQGMPSPEELQRMWLQQQQAGGQPSATTFLGQNRA